MNRQFRAAVLAAAAMLLLILCMAPPAAAATAITVEADTGEAKPGDTVTFTIVMGPVSELGTLQMVLEIPDGLTYVPGSGRLAPDLKKTLGFDLLDFTEISLMINGVALLEDYSSTTDTQLCTFQCTVDEGFSGTARLGLTNLEFYSCVTWTDHTDEFIVNEAVVNIPGGSGGDETEITDTGAGDDSSGIPGSEGNTPVPKTYRRLEKRPLKKEKGNRRPAVRAGEGKHADEGYEE